MLEIYIYIYIQYSVLLMSVSHKNRIYITSLNSFKHYWFDFLWLSAPTKTNFAVFDVQFPFDIKNEDNINEMGAWLGNVVSLWEAMIKQKFLSASSMATVHVVQLQS